VTESAEVEVGVVGFGYVLEVSEALGAFHARDGPVGRGISRIETREREIGIVRAGLSDPRSCESSRLANRVFSYPRL
jgi:hypothetical protein